MESDDKASAIAALQRGLDLGMRHVDTAEMYGAGDVELMVGEALRGRREQAFVVSKLLPLNGSHGAAIRACEASLSRLGIEQLDMYLLHWPGSHPLEETLGAFEALVEQGKIARWGVSNFDVKELEEAQRIAPGKIASNQVLYHVLERAIEHRIIPWCVAHDVPLVAYSPFGSGRFPAAPEGGEVLARIASDKGATARQVALQFLTRQRGVYAIPKASQTEHVEDNHGAESLKLEQEDLEAIDRAFPRGSDKALPFL